MWVALYSMALARALRSPFRREVTLTGSRGGAVSANRHRLMGVDLSAGKRVLLG